MSARRGSAAHSEDHPRVGASKAGRRPAAVQERSRMASGNQTTARTWRLKTLRGPAVLLRRLRSGKNLARRPRRVRQGSPAPKAAIELSTSAACFRLVCGSSTARLTARLRLVYAFRLLVYGSSTRRLWLVCGSSAARLPLFYGVCRSSAARLRLVDASSTRRLRFVYGSSTHGLRLVYKSFMARLRVVYASCARRLRLVSTAPLWLVFTTSAHRLRVV
jgi:hypothetical protein